MVHQFSRTELLIGAEGLATLRKAKVAIFGIGGVGSYCAEALTRSGIGKINLIDYDDICLTNLNRQIHALHSTIGKPKVEVMRQRILDINPHAEVKAVKAMYRPENREELIEADTDYIIDAIDMSSAKIDLITSAVYKGIPIVSSMGAGNNLDPTKLRVADLSCTTTCPLAKVVRKELRKRGIEKGITVVYSTGQVVKPGQVECPSDNNDECDGAEVMDNKHKVIPGSIAFVPSVAGLLLAGYVVNSLLENER